MCLILGGLMVLSIVFMLISALKSYAAVADVKETDVGLKYGQSAVQTVTLFSSGGFEVELPGIYTVDTDARTELVFSADGNEYKYNKDILVNPKKGNGSDDTGIGLNIVGGYHVAISEYRTGEVGSGNDNPVYIENGQSEQGQSTYKFTKDNINEYIKQFRNIVEANNGTLHLSIAVFPAYINGGYYIMAGSCETLSEADDIKSTLELVFTMDASVFAPDPDVITVHDAKNEILFETDRCKDLVIKPEGTALTYEGAEYNGRFILTRSNAYGDALSVINRIATDDLVRACLSVEYPENTDPELLKALSVIYRTKLNLSSGVHSADGFDVCTDHHCMRYIGCGKVVKGGSIDLAVQATAGEIITHSGKPIHAQISNSCGNSTVSSKDAFGFECAYLVSSVKDGLDSEKVFNEWTRQYSASELSSILKMNSYDEIRGSIKTVAVNARSENSLYVTSLTFTDIFGNEATVTGSEKIRSLFGGDLPSASFAVSKAGKPVQIVYTDNEGVVCTIDKTLTGTPGYFIFAGEGDGSGTGFDLSAAVKLISAGKNYKELIAAYYPGVEIKNAK